MFTNRFVNVRPVLFPPAPRNIRRYRGLPIPARLFLCCLIPHVWVGIGVIFVILWNVAAAVAGHDTTGAVIDHSTHAGKKSTTYTIRYAYHEDGTRHTDSQSVDLATFRRLAVGSSVPVRSFHLLGFGSSYLGNTSFADRGIFFLFIWALVWNTAMGGLLLGIILPPLRQRKLLRLGDATPGRITGKYIQPGKSKTYQVNFTFDSPFGEDIHAKMKVDQPAYHFANTGDLVTVIYDPAKPKRSAVYECLQYRALDEHGGEIAG